MSTVVTGSLTWAVTAYARDIATMSIQYVQWRSILKGLNCMNISPGFFTHSLVPDQTFRPGLMLFKLLSIPIDIHLFRLGS